MSEYKKAMGKLVRMARAKCDKWQGKDWDIPMGNGRFRYGKLRSFEHVK